MKAKVWPITQSMEKSPAEFQRRKEAVPDRISHQCDGKTVCPLTKGIDTTVLETADVMKVSKGLDLQAFRRESF
jgi:hypothetical protein